MKVPGISQIMREASTLWRNRRCISPLWQIIRNDDLSPPSLRSARRFFARNHAETVRSLAPVDASVQPIPWYTYSLIDYISDLETSDWAVLEFGSGNSTLYWASRCESVVAFENDASWMARMQEIAPCNAQMIFYSAADDFAGLNALKRSPDLVAIDGFNRLLCARECLTRFGTRPLYILDNSDWLPRTAEELRNAGTYEIRFKGPGPINAFNWATSLFVSPESIKYLLTKNKDCSVPGGLPPGNYESINIREDE